MILLAACAPQAAPAPAAQAPAPAVAAAPAAAPVVAGQAKPAWQEKWDTILAAANKEGKLVLYTSGGPEMRTAFTKGIKNAYGLDAEVVTGRAPELNVKLLAERRAGLYPEDVYVGSTNTIVNDLKPSGMFESLDSSLILPDVSDPKAWFKGELPWFDRDHVGIVFFLFPGRPIAVNTTLIKPDDVKSWRDLLNPKWKGKLAMNDPTISGAGQLILLVMDLTVGWDYVKELAKAEPMIIRDQRQQMDWLSHGKISILIAPKTETFGEFLKAGAPVAIVQPSEGSSINVGSGAIALFKSQNAPHPNAAKVFLNWLLSKQGQEVAVESVLQQSARMDVSTANLPPDLVRIPGQKYVPVYDEPALARREVTNKLGFDVFSPLVPK